MYKGDQIIFIDTPGLHESEKTLNKLMIDVAIKSISSCDLIMFVVSIYDDLSEYEKFLSLDAKTKHIVVINKCDLVSNDELLAKLGEYSKYSDKFEAILPFSIKKASFKAPLLGCVAKLLPKHPYFYDPELLSATNERDIYKDFILESLYENLNQELPYASEAVITSFKEDRGMLFIDANIITDTNSHKMMIVGKKGETIKRIGIGARKKISSFCGQKVMLKLFVQIRKNWQKDEDFVKKMIENF